MLENNSNLVAVVVFFIISYKAAFLLDDSGCGPEPHRNLHVIDQAPRALRGRGTCKIENSGVSCQPFHFLIFHFWFHYTLCSTFFIIFEEFFTILT